MVITPMVHLANDHPITWQPMESMEQQAACWLQHVLHLAIWRRFGDCGLEKNRGRSWKCFTYGATATNRKKCSPGLVPLCWPPSNMTRWLGPCLASHQLHEMSTSCHQMWKAGDFYFFFSRHTACNRMSSMTNTRNLSYIKLLFNPLKNLCLLESSSHLSKI